jgi:hypothetical protein
LPATACWFKSGQGHQGGAAVGQSWIFQVNPKRFDVDAFLATRPGPTRWLVTRYGDEMRPGDDVFIWRAAASAGDLNSGIIAKASILSAPTTGTDDPNSIPFWKNDADKTSVALRAGIRIAAVADKDGVLQRSTLADDPALGSLLILRMANQTNYKLEPRLAERLNELWAATTKGWSRSGTFPQSWRMAMRVGDGGYEMWDECFDLGVAAITYDGISETDFSHMSLADASTAWAPLAPAQKASFRCLVYEMRGGDVIYVKQGSRIVSKGIIRAPFGQRAYAFNAAARRIIDPNGTPWLQQVRVAWLNDFEPVEIEVGSNQRYTIQLLSDEDIERLEVSLGRWIADQLSPEPEQDEHTLLSTESYLRASPARIRIIVRQHNDLSNGFSDWLKTNHGVCPIREKQQIDVRFKLGSVHVLAELKVCFGVEARRAIREALGQLLEYNFYPVRQPTDVWLVVLDQEPAESDRAYIDLLRERLSLPLFLGWRAEPEFHFHPAWP